MGAAICLRLANAGWTVHAGVREEAQAEHLRAQNPLIRPIQLDITNEQHVTTLADRLGGPLDAVVNNAGIAHGGPVEAVPPHEWRACFDVNVVAQVVVTQAVLPKLRESQGRVVFISSTVGRTVATLEGPSSASKFALEAVADILRIELRPWQIFVSVIEPGPTNTETWRNMGGMLDEMEAGLSPAHRELYRQHLLGLRKLLSTLGSRGGSPDLVAKYVERALTDRHPKARYAAGAQAVVLANMGRVLPTRVGDAMAARMGGWK
ncbi:SDR family NAD(P)-dependent oxidoreductase [Propionibacteriaceae bacterium G1746]